jgi:hypothetical protein
VNTSYFPGFPALSAGKVGLWTKAGGVTYFDDFRIAGK